MKPEGRQITLASGIKATICRIFSAASLVLWFSSFAQVSLTTPEKWTTATSLDLGFGIFRLELSHNSPETIRQELLDTNLVRLIARSIGLSEVELATVQIVPAAVGSSVELYQIGKSDKAFNAISERLRSYIQARDEGHTKGFLFAAITNNIQPLSFADTDLRVLVLNRPLIPASWVKKADSGTQTNKAGQAAGISKTTTIINGRMQTTSVTNMPKFDEVCRWVSYTITDGEITWLYVLNFKANDRLDFIDDSRRDAKEDDPKFQKAIKDVEDEVEAEMRKQGTFGKWGSVRTFWHLKKERLKAKGIDWRSPAELNPNAIFD